MRARQILRELHVRPLWLMVLPVLSAPALLSGQSAEALLRETAKNYQTLRNYELSGHATMAKPGSVWQVVWEFGVVGPHEAPAADGGPAKIAPGGGRVGRSRFVKTVADSSEAQPSTMFPFALLTEFGKRIDENVVGVERTGEETVRFNGGDVACEVLKVTYTPSTYERQHPESVTYWIDPQKHLVLKETLTASAGRNAGEGLWTLVFDSVTFNRPIPEWARDMGKAPDFRERTEWVGKPAPAFTLPASDGSVVALSSLRGKEVLLDFWSILCGPCKLEMPTLETVGREYESRGVVLLGISFDPVEKSKAWLEQNKHALRTLTDSDFAVSDAYKVQGIPALVLIGRDGKVKRYWDGAVTKEMVERALSK